MRWGVYGGLSRSESVEKLQPFNTGPGLDIELESEPIDVAVYSHIGWFIERNLVQNLFVETGMMYEKRGYTRGEYVPMYDASFNFQHKLPYVGIPLQVNYYLINRKFKFHVTAGQKVGWCFDGEKALSKNFSASVNGREFDSSAVRPTEIPVGKDGLYKSFNYDLLFGGGLGIGRFTFVVTYNLGLNNLSNFEMITYNSRVFNYGLRIDLTKK